MGEPKDGPLADWFASMCEDEALSAPMTFSASYGTGVVEAPGFDLVIKNDDGTVERTRFLLVEDDDDDQAE